MPLSPYDSDDPWDTALGRALRAELVGPAGDVDALDPIDVTRDREWIATRDDGARVEFVADDEWAEYMIYGRDGELRETGDVADAEAMARFVAGFLREP